MADQPLKHRVLLKILRRYGVIEDRSRGKGGHSLLIRQVNGKRKRYPISAHGRGTEHCDHVVKAVRRAFSLTAEDSVSDQEFYGK